MQIKKLATVRKLVVHCSATPPDMDIGAAEIERWHRAGGYLRIGYHLVIRRNGVVEAGRPLDEPGAHAAGHNHDSIGICLVGGVRKIKDADGADDADGPRWDLIPEDNFTPAQWASLRQIVLGLLNKHPGAKVLGHRDLPGVTKACPSTDIGAWVARGYSPKE